MSQVTYDRAIIFKAGIYTATQTWNGPKIEVTITPPNEDLRQLITHEVTQNGQITLKQRGSCWEIVTTMR